MACLRLLTLRPERPLLSLPRFISCIARCTFLPLARPYLRAMIDVLFRLRRRICGLSLGEQANAEPAQ
jgi:hypothetical protein